MAKKKNGGKGKPQRADKAPPTPSSAIPKQQDSALPSPEKTPTTSKPRSLPGSPFHTPPTSPSTPVAGLPAISAILESAEQEQKETPAIDAAPPVDLQLPTPREPEAALPPVTEGDSISEDQQEPVAEGSANQSGLLLVDGVEPEGSTEAAEPGAHAQPESEEQGSESLRNQASATPEQVTGAAVDADTGDDAVANATGPVEEDEVTPDPADDLGKPLPPPPADEEQEEGEGKGEGRAEAIPKHDGEEQDLSHNQEIQSTDAAKQADELLAYLDSIAKSDSEGAADLSTSEEDGKFAQASTSEPTSLEATEETANDSLPPPLGTTEQVTNDTTDAHDLVEAPTHTEEVSDLVDLHSSVAPQEKATTESGVVSGEQMHTEQAPAESTPSTELADNDENSNPDAAAEDHSTSRQEEEASHDMNTSSPPEGRVDEKAPAQVEAEDTIELDDGLGNSGVDDTGAANEESDPVPPPDEETAPLSAGNEPGAGDADGQKLSEPSGATEREDQEPPQKELENDATNAADSSSALWDLKTPVAPESASVGKEAPVQPTAEHGLEDAAAKDPADNSAPIYGTQDETGDPSPSSANPGGEEPDTQPQLEATPEDDAQITTAPPPDEQQPEGDDSADNLAGGIPSGGEGTEQAEGAHDTAISLEDHPEAEVEVDGEGKSLPPADQEQLQPGENVTADTLPAGTSSDEESKEIAEGLRDTTEALPNHAPEGDAGERPSRPFSVVDAVSLPVPDLPGPSEEPQSEPRQAEELSIQGTDVTPTLEETTAVEDTGDNQTADATSATQPLGQIDDTASTTATPTNGAPLYMPQNLGSPSLTAQDVATPEIVAISEMFGTMKAALLAMTSAFDRLQAQTERMAANTVQIKAAEQLSVLKAALEQQITRQKEEVEAVRVSLQSKIKAAVEEKIRGRLREVIQQSVKAQVEEKVRAQMALQIPEDLRQQVISHQRKIIQVKTALHNSEARMYNALQTVPGARLRPLLRPLPTPEQSPVIINMSRSNSMGNATLATPWSSFPSGPAPTPIRRSVSNSMRVGGGGLDTVPPTPSKHFPRDLTALFALSQEETRRLLREYGLKSTAPSPAVENYGGATPMRARGLSIVSEEGPVEEDPEVHAKDMNMFMAHIGVPFLMIPPPKEKPGEEMPPLSSRTRRKMLTPLIIK